MGMIQKCLKELKMDTAVALLRASREFWPEGEVFGSLEIRPEEELLLLRTLFYSDLPGEWISQQFFSVPKRKQNNTLK